MIENKIKKQGIDTFFISQCFELLYDMCSYFVNTAENGVAQGIYTEVLEYEREALAIHYTSINACAGFMNLILLGNENNMLSSSTDHFYLPFEICLKRLSYASDSYAFDLAFELFFTFMFIFDDEEAEYYINEIIYNTCDAFVKNGICDLEILDFILQKVYTYTQDKENTLSAMEDLLACLVETHKSTFDKEVDAYLEYIEKVLNGID